MKKALSVFLALVLVFTFCTPAAFANEPPEQEPEATTFHAPTIRQMIEANLALDNIDEDFFHKLANAYLANPALLVETIQDLPGDDITYLARAISYDLQKTGRESEAVIPSTCNTPITSAIAKLIFDQAGNEDNAALDSFCDDLLYAFVPTQASILSSDEMYVSTPVLSTTQADIYTNATATFTVGSLSPSSESRSCIYRLYRTNGSTSTLVKFGNATIPANMHSTTVTASFTNNAVGEYSYYVQVLISSSSTLTSDTSDSITVTGTWHITVELTADRTQLGTITLFNGEGTQVSTSICLGKSAYNYPMNQTDGHTPIGIYEAYLDGYKADTEAYGIYQYIRMHGVSGYVVDACSHRDGLLIHGGRTEYNDNPTEPLHHTYGCVRVLGTYQLQLENELTSLANSYHYAIGQVTITQDGQTTL